MSRRGLWGLLLFAVSYGPGEADAANLLELANGTIILSASANPVAALSLTDGAPATSGHNVGRQDGLPTTCSSSSRRPRSATSVSRDRAHGRARGGLHSIHFDFDKATLRPGAGPALEALLEALLAALKANAALKVSIEGHTDAQGEDAYDLDLSARRARSIVAWLTERGIAADRLAPSGKGESQPMASNDTADGRALNRRVEVVKR